MTKGAKTPDPDRIDALLEEMAAVRSPDPSPDLMARVLADAEAHLPPPGGVRAAVPWWRQVLADIGGWGAVGGLAAATVAGLAIGLGALDATGADALWTLGYDGYYDSDLGLDAFGWAIEEG